MLVSARPPAACLPLPRCAFASLPLWFIASFTYWTFVLFILWTEAANQWSSGPLLHVEQCSFCEQKQRISGAMGHCYTAHTAVHVRGDMRHWGRHHTTPQHWIIAPYRRCVEVIRAPQHTTVRTYHVIRPLRRSAYASGPLFCACARPLRIGSSIPRQRGRKMFKIGTPPENTDSQPLTIVY